jgi:siroheme decarboxylase
MMILTAQDKLLLNRIQENFPVDMHPYAVIGKELNMSEEEVVDRIRRLKAEGYIRRIGPFFNSRELGYTSTLVALAVPDEKVEETAKIINRYIGVTHNYIRPGTYNMWFTFIASSAEQLQQSLADICQKTGISNMLVLPSSHMFKVNVNLRIMEDGK